MKNQNTKSRILSEALKLFAQEGYEAVNVEQIADAVGIKAPSLYKHYRSKRAIFESILAEMERRDREQAAACDLPEDTIDIVPEEYENPSIDDLINFTKAMFRHWTEDEFAASFRRMLTIPAGEHYAAHIQAKLTEGVDEAQHIGVVSNAQIGAHFILFNVFTADNDNDFRYVLQLF